MKKVLLGLLCLTFMFSCGEAETWYEKVAGGGDNDETSSNNEIGFVHRGIAKRAFSRSFQLSDDIIVQNADLADGMLIVNLERVIPDEKKPRLIPIGQ